MHFVLIDDIAEHNQLLSSRLQQLCLQQGIDCHIALTASTPDAVAAYAAKCTHPTVYFMDIQLGKNETSLSLSETIEKNGQESYIVYVSGHPQYALECLHTHAFDFLLKPWTDDQLSACLQAIMRAHARRPAETTLQISTGSRLIMTPLSDIICFSREKMNIRMQLTDGSSLVWRESFEHLLPRLQAGRFALCHRSHIVNLQKIRQIDWETNTMILSDGTQLPISRRREQALKSMLRQMEGT